MNKAARALYLYYGKNHKWSPSELQAVNDECKKSFWDFYGDAEIPSVDKYETKANRNNGKQNPVFRILAGHISPLGDKIPYYKLINRMCFWMATGSGKTLVMVKLIEYLHSLMKHKEIPPYNILMLAPSEHLIKQIRQTVDEVNQSRLFVDLVPLREFHREHRKWLTDTMTVYYHRSDNISDVQKDALTDYRAYENCGKWYVFLDEAHKGSKEDSKRQTYYSIMSREGFLFNFSATLTDR